MNPIPITRRNFQKIIQFYLFETPVRTRKAIPTSERDSNDPQAKYKCNFKKVSKRGITFEDRGLDGANLNTVRAAMIRVTNVNLIAVDNKEEVEARAKDEKGEYIVIWRNESNFSITEGYFYCIRNTFAHGDFVVNGNIYTFKNEKDENEVRGMACIKESSLLAWIDLVNMSVDEIKKAGK